MQTSVRTTYGEFSGVQAELESGEPLAIERHSPSTNSHGSGAGLLASKLQSPTETLGAIEHVIVSDQRAATAPGVAGLEGALPSSRFRLIDRVTNIVLALVALVVTAPIMLLMAIAIKLTSKGPILYAQSRIGLNRRGNRSANRRQDSRSHLWARFVALHDDHRTRDLGGNVFRIYKFRTMCEDAESHSGIVWAVKQDPRTTSIGCFLRKFRLDELPQFYNVLKGDMNIVGPRPERPSIFARMRDAIDDYPLRQHAKPGITGWAQINLFYDSCVDDVRKKVLYDLEYLRQKSLVKDLKIMANTLPALLLRRRGW
jgi:lipopolysaccharide/colanic/teichoic acid biosynthesis glycosyltransferase